jgi:eukaryotic-like serine/threonine-protein kinase
MTRDDDHGPGGPSVTVTLTDPAAPAPAPAPGVLETGTKFGRYLVLERLGSGGMGVVYAAYDPELDRKLAIKILRPEIGRAQTRLRREAQAMARLQHPNVIAVHDVGFVDERVFVAMELVDGTTLAQWLVERDRAWHEIVERFVQAGRGLAAAHEVGLVHRDFKPANVLVGRDGRVRVVDFGLARAVGKEEPAESTPTPTPTSTPTPTPTPSLSPIPMPSLLDTLTRAGTLVGTPTYMSPEQLQGLPTNAKSDQFSFCVALYRALFGQRPYEGENVQAIAAELLRGRLRPPPTTSEVPAEVQAAILRGLATDADARWPTMDALLSALQQPTGESVPPPPRAIAPPRRLPQTLALVAAVGVLVALITAAVTRRAQRPAATPPSSRASFAALGFANGSGRAEAAWVSTALTELVSAEVAAQGALRRVPPQRVTALRRELNLADGAVSLAALEQARNAFHADYVLSGSYTADGSGKLRFDVAVRHAQSGTVVASASESGDEETLPVLAAHAGETLRRGLGLGSLSRADEALARASLPTDPTTMRLYAEGLAKLRLFDALGARELLQRAVAADSSFALGHAALAEAFRHLGHQADEEREAQLAWDHAASLPRDQQLVVEANLRVARREWPRALQLYRALCEFFPGSLEFGLGLAQVQIDAGEAKGALASIAQLRREVPAAAHDARAELLEARACESLGDSHGQDAAARTAVAKARALGSSDLVGEGLLAEAMAALTLGDRSRAAARANEAQTILEHVGNPSRMGEALRIRAWIAFKSGDLILARALSQQSVEAFERLGADGQLANALNTVAGVESDLNHHAEATALYRRALPLFERAANRLGVAKVHANIGAQLAAAGRFADSEVEQLQALAELRRIGARRNEAISLETIGSLYTDIGELHKAVDFERQGLALATELDDATTIAQTRAKLGIALGYLGQLDAAEETLKKAIAESDRIGQGWRSGFTRAELARLYLAAGRTADALALAREADEQRRRAHVDGGLGAATLARALVASGRIGEARAAVDFALAHDHDDLVVHAAAADVEVAEGHAEAAIARLQARLAGGSWPSPSRLEAQLAMARAELAAGRGRTARALLGATLAEARKKGFALIARAAAAAE